MTKEVEEAIKHLFEQLEKDKDHNSVLLITELPEREIIFALDLDKEDAETSFEHLCKAAILGVQQFIKQKGVEGVETAFDFFMLTILYLINHNHGLLMRFHSAYQAVVKNKDLNMALEREEKDASNIEEAAKFCIKTDNSIN